MRNQYLGTNVPRPSETSASWRDQWVDSEGCNPVNLSRMGKSTPIVALTFVIFP
jgi:hypothetical protein